MINLDIRIKADTPEELADAFAFLLDKGVDLSVVGPVPNPPAGTKGATQAEGDTDNVVSLNRSRPDQGRHHA